MKKLILILFLFSSSACFCQDVLQIDSAGKKLKDYYLSLNVENLWLAGHHVNWETGEPDKPESKEGIKTHCSAFVASACEGIGIYILRPPEHGQVLLSNAQYDWLFSKKSSKEGWKEIKENKYSTAQQYANDGYIVIAAIKNPDDSKAGHIALVMPFETDITSLTQNGPELIQAGTENSNSISLKEGFKHHVKWPENEVVFFYNETQYSK
jgi:hypothetical protein